MLAYYFIAFQSEQLSNRSSDLRLGGCPRRDCKLKKPYDHRMLHTQKHAAVFKAKFSQAVKFNDSNTVEILLLAAQENVRL